MTAIIIIPPGWNPHQNEPAIDSAPSECDPCAPVDLTNWVCGGRPPRSAPFLRIDNTLPDDDAMHQSIEHHGPSK